ncbi:glycosyltransferase [Blastococcus sp. Marseille-P5729]|uniref:glycosyltransferase n=1 Tax=Blastococcus sp. Marseille-P5729 TaxID=2086582 RepID=UPI000D108C6A|nr:glycosyltransferase [Blastococcus sp. Marseille-P5729]
MPADRRLKVLRLANFVSPTSGGIRTVMRRLSHAHADLGVHSTIVVPGPSSGIEAVPGVLDVGTLPGMPLAPGQPYRLVLSRPAIRSLIDEVRPDVVEVHDQLTLAWVGGECRGRGIRSVLVAHERLDLLAAFWSRLPVAARPTLRWLARLGRSVDAVVAPSEFAATPYADAGIDVSVIPWGVDHSIFHLRDVTTRSSEARPTAGGDSEAKPTAGGIRLVHAGRLSAEKDPTLSARAAEYIAGTGVDVELIVIGSGPEAAQVARHPHARMVGYVDGPHRMAELLRSADVFVAPGPFETFGVSALEAMACGLPVVCRESGSISEIPQTRPAPGTAQGFGEAALALRRDPRARAGSAASAASYTWEEAARQLLAGYER